jgi:hypothetical protein
MDGKGFEDRIASLDVSLFSAIPSQSSEGDRRSLLATQASVRTAVDRYVYLEIGSHLGGSIQPHLLDPKCIKIYSIDKRPSSQPDERGGLFDYPGNSTERMLSLLTAIDSTGVQKVECFDSDSRSTPTSRLKLRPNLCFIDGEHTPSAVVADFEFCLSVCAPGATIAFHDADIVFRGLRSAIATLNELRRPFTAHRLSDAVYVICLDDGPVSKSLTGFSSLARKDDLRSYSHDLRLLRWRFRQRVTDAKRWLRRVRPSRARSDSPSIYG